MSPLRDPAAAAISNLADAVTIAAGRIRVASAMPDVPPLDIDAAPPVSGRVARYLYACHYAFDRNLAGLEPGSRAVLGLPRSDPAFLRALQAANPAETYLAAGWRVVARDEDGLAVERAGLGLRLDRDRHLPPAMREARPGDLVQVRFPAWSPGGIGGYCFAHSAAGPVTAPRVARLYLNLRPEAAVEVTGRLLHRLNRLALPYSFKILSDPRRFTRRDAAVLYIARDDADAAMAILAAVHSGTRSGFRNAVPTFTLRLGDGIAVADEPADAAAGRSFGQSRTSLVADALCRLAATHATAGPRQAAAAISATFVAAGLDPKRPHLRDRDAPDYSMAKPAAVTA